MDKESAINPIDNENGDLEQGAAGMSKVDSGVQFEEMASEPKLMVPDVQDGVLQVTDREKPVEQPSAEESGASASKEEMSDSGVQDETGSRDADDKSENAEPSATDQIEAAATAAENNAKEEKALKRAFEPGRSAVETHTELEDSRPVDVRQEFLDQIHNPKPKSKLGAGKKIAITLAVVLVLGIAGLSTWWFAYYSQPDIVLADALHKFIQSDSVSYGAILETRVDNDGENVTNTMFLNGQVNGLTEFSQYLNLGLIDAGGDVQASGMAIDHTL